ncbi:MAG: nucleotidyltransferase domain-containing protein [Nanoarchaeota archaeon]
MVNLITRKEMAIINKKMQGHSLTQNESNILSKSIRPKLKEIKKINADMLLNRIEYNQKARVIEHKIQELVTASVKKVESIILFGSAVQTNYKTYNDIDLLIITKEKLRLSAGDKYAMILDIINHAKNSGLNLDIQMIDRKSFHYQSAHSPSLIYQLQDSKIIYGNIKIPSRKELSKLDLRMKLDWSDIDNEESDGKEIYQSLRNTLLVKLLSNKVVDNAVLNQKVTQELGERLLQRLKDNRASLLEKKLVMRHIKKLSEDTDKDIREAQWEKIVL